MDKKKSYVIGGDASKSLSPDIFNYWFKKYKIPGTYEYVEIKKESFDKEILNVLNLKNLCGLNITIPFKENIIKILTSIDEDATQIGAVNCVTINGKKIKGSNTDWIGFQKSINKKVLNKNNALILGYGGAAKAIKYALQKEGYKKIKIFNRSLEKLNNINNKNIKCYPLDDFLNHSKSADLIINTIPVDFLKGQKIIINDNAAICDIVYKPMKTKFLNHFINHKNIIYGIHMLAYQAAPCFYKWYGIMPEVNDDLIFLLEKKAK